SDHDHAARASMQNVVETLAQRGPRGDHLKRPYEPGRLARLELCDELIPGTRRHEGRFYLALGSVASPGPGASREWTRLRARTLCLSTTISGGDCSFPSPQSGSNRIAQRSVRLGREHRLQTEPCRLGDTPIAVCDRSELAGQPELAEACKWP